MSRYDIRPLVAMLCDRRSRDEKEMILRAISALIKDDRDEEAESIHLSGSGYLAGGAAMSRGQP